MAASLTLICQGETAAGRGSRFPDDEPLQAREWQRARRLQSLVARYHTVWIAPDAAARQTASALSLPIVQAAELAEPDYGIWAGRPLREVMMQDADTFRAWLEGAPPPGGESRDQLLARCGSWLNKRVDIQGRHCAIASASAIRAMIVNVLGAPPQSFERIDIHPLSITELRSDGRRWHFCVFGER
ncbi:histidine phosphatase family protein [Raoultella planticola]|uniref:Histidine phosphatase family protein n=1 Tax=Raoultella planticola TaxID=575 RepID=A0ABU5LVU6_RAOPL|nr:histidine phosphatase family protein [Raoultella planticola]MDW4552335.1 histidine phosphatase family protein [Raoultella planticola]MDZ7444048.1 histidine phosphatase family protein [Raoultella planticola]MDZ7464077.1 histidine phosphatase family protein [Raoultella planticola]MDZ7505847.1 histidine phosphatase family protein [Raoultella planticola]MEA5398293.1 histidine phosphatase family protein [Raoultella planticola]